MPCRIKFFEVSTYTKDSLRKDLLSSKKTMILSKDGEHVIYKDGMEFDNNSIVYVGIPQNTIVRI